MTKENAHEFLPIIQALAAGKDIELYDNLKWIPLHNPVYFDHPSHEYRIKPEPVMVPLGPEDVPPGSAIRSQDGYWSLIVRSDEQGLNISTRGSLITWDELLTYWQIKRPGEDWKPCCKPAQ